MEKQLKETFNYSAEDVRYININESSTPTIMLRVGAEKISSKLVFFARFALSLLTIMERIEE